MGLDNFKKFIGPKKNNAAVKEKFKQDKKLAKKMRQEAIDRHFEEKRALRANAFAKDASSPKSPKHRGAGIDQPPAGKSSKSPREASPSGESLETEKMPLNKFLAHCGVASRRAAVSVISSGKVTVNKVVVTEPSFKVSDADQICLQGKRLFVTRNLVYILLNKPKDYITTTEDPQHRKTVLQLIQHATNQRVYPVGRLDRNTSGVLLLTNDGQLTQELTHPSFQVQKVYEVKLEKPLSKNDFDKILSGLKLEDGVIQADALGYPDPKNKSVVGIELHSGRNRIVRRIFEHLGYEVKALDRVMYGPLTKKNVERGKWRYLSEKEVRILKYLHGKKAKTKFSSDPQMDSDAFL